METVIIAIGSNLGNRLLTIRKAGEFLAELSCQSVTKASIWESEPVGGAKFTFYNTAAKITTSLSPIELLTKLKNFEQQCGREKNPERWGPRVLDLDIIRYGNLVIDDDTLIIPHPEYKKRLFVLLPMEEIDKHWHDPGNRETVSGMIQSAPEIEIRKTEFSW
jgi:2-amino-4-hydroxy-6-hydroxymethyldihydropteridine diphosphokinase